MLCGWSITCSDPTTSPMHWPASIDCASLIESSARSPYWHMKSTDLCRSTSALSHVSPTYPVDDHCVLSAPIASISRLSTVGSQALTVTGPQTWNDFPEDVTSAESLTTFRCLLKTHLFMKSFPDYLLDINWLSPVDLAVVPLLRPPKNSLIENCLIDCVTMSG